MITKTYTVTVPGKPKPKGSMICKRNRLHQLRETVDNEAWRRDLTRFLKRIPEHADVDQPIGVRVVFTLRRPDAHIGTGRNAGIVKPWALLVRAVSHKGGDVDKLARLLLDAMQDAGVLPDDCQVVELVARKALTEDPRTRDVLDYPGAVVTIYPVEST